MRERHGEAPCLEAKRTMFRFWKSGPDGDPSEPQDGARMIDVAGMLRQASTLVSVGQLVKNGKKDIHLLSRRKIDELICRALKNIVAKYRAAGVLEDPVSPEQIEEDSRREFSDLLSQHQETAKAGEDFAQSKLALDAMLRDLRTDLAQQRVLADGRLPAEIERVALESRFDRLCVHLSAMDRALETLFSSKLYTYRQLQVLLRQAVAARKAAALKAKNAPIRKVLQVVLEHPPVAAEPVDAVEKNRRKRISFDTIDLELGRGLDVGTVNICAAARKVSSGETVYTLQRNAFLDVRDTDFARRLLKLDLDYVVRGDRGLVIGDSAFELANVFERPSRRPMKDGKISPEEPEAIPVVSYLVAQLLGLPRQVGEICVFSLPGGPIEADSGFLYHRSALERAISEVGYTPRPMLDSHVIVTAELKEQEYTGVGVSFGGGTVNVCLAYKGVPAFAFSTLRGGDWIDQSAAAALGLPAPVVCAAKEAGMDLRSPKGRVQEAIAIYTRDFIHHTVRTMMEKMNDADQLPAFTKPVPLVCAGGSSMIRGFIDALREAFDEVEFPIDVSEIRLAANPLRAVAAGCLQVAIEETRALTEKPADVSPAALERAAITGVPQADHEAARRIARLQEAAAGEKRDSWDGAEFGGNGNNNFGSH